MCLKGPCNASTRPGRTRTQEIHWQAISLGFKNREYIQLGEVAKINHDIFLFSNLASFLIRSSKTRALQGAKNCCPANLTANLLQQSMKE
jgi:hypothetical protein